MRELILKKTPLTIAIVGKGGVGKSVITTLIAKVISQDYSFKILLIDADPAHPHLSNMVNLIPEKSLEELRLEAIEAALKTKKSPKNIAENIDFKIYEAMAESKDYCLFSIGQPEGPGCFCPSNTLLKRVIESISKDFDIILIDCEAGLEQINRMVIESVDIILIITDISLRSVETANSIRKVAQKFTKFKYLGVIINKVRADIKNIVSKLNEMNLPIIGQIPDDQNIIQYELEGKGIIDLPKNSVSLTSIKELIKNLLEIEI